MLGEDEAVYATAEALAERREAVLDRLDRLENAARLAASRTSARCSQLSAEKLWSSLLGSLGMCKDEIQN